MYWRDKAALINEEKAVDRDGYKITKETRQTVYVNKKSAMYSEFYTTKQTGGKIALVLEVPGADYHGETREGQLYEVVRNYTRNGEKYELNCKQAAEPPQDSADMSINSILETALDPVAPAEADVYEGKKSVYITFNYDTVPGNFGDDESEHERVLVQVHLYAPTGLNVLGKIRAIKKALSAAERSKNSGIQCVETCGGYEVEWLELTVDDLMEDWTKPDKPVLVITIGETEAEP